MAASETTATAYQALHDRFKRIGDLNHAHAMLSWDEAAIMPTGGGESRAESLATLAGLIHEMVSAAATGELADAAANEDLDPWQAANVAIIRRDWQRAQAVPGDLVEALSKATSSCEQAWRWARGRNDWQAVAGRLDTVVGLVRDKAQALASHLVCSPYDALLDSYEPGLTQARIDPVFAELDAALPALIDDAIGSQEAPPTASGPFPTTRQAALGHAVMAALGFDFERGRLDVSHHPFCGGEPDDTRITTRYDEQDFLTSMFAVLHETGHALYQQGLPKAWRGQPVGDAGGMALHESQSLLMEMQVCRSRAFLELAAPIIQRELLGAATNAAAWQPDALLAQATRVERSFIRVDADELTYPLHIILRYELEKALLDGALRIADIPEAWNARMQDALGLSTAGNDADGAMQDVHWFGGLIGYFPTYTLGAVIAAQLFDAAGRDLPDLEGAIRGGDMRVLVDWLRERIHRRGRLRPSMALVAEATGSELRTEPFLAHLRGRYGPATRHRAGAHG